MEISLVANFHLAIYQAPITPVMSAGGVRQNMRFQVLRAYKTERLGIAATEGVVMISMKNIVFRNFKMRAGPLWIGFTILFVTSSSGIGQEIGSNAQERLRRKCGEVKTSDNKLVALSRFVGFLEGRLDIEAPPGWLDLVLKSVNGKNEIDYSLQHIQLRKTRRALLQKGSVMHSEIPTKLKVPKSLNVDKKRFNYIVDKQNIFVFAGNAARFDGKLICIDHVKGNEVWSLQTDSTKVSEGHKLTTGIELGDSFLVANESFLVVFSWNLSLARVLVIDRATGSVIGRYAVPGVTKTETTNND